MKVRAIFTGTNGSLGYETGREYTLYVHRDMKCITIERSAPEDDYWCVNNGWCTYSTIYTFLANWDCIRKVA
jgi:hypothetical protein